MRYYSLKDKNITVSFKEATIQGQASDKGLFFPEHIPVVDKDFFSNIEGYSREEIAFQVMLPFVQGDIPEKALEEIIAETIDFAIPLVPIQDRVYSLELFHGPTLAFKDVGARFMSRCLGYFVRNQNRKVTVLVATSGDTGGAVANGFYGVDGVEVVILYPSGKVSSVQEAQLTTLGNNITALEVEGNFDDCQRLVKQAFSDPELNAELFLTSANSINVARWLPQQIYYFLAWQQWPYKNEPPVVCVPSGNFGNICAGLLAYKSGLPVQQFLAACNANDVVPEYLQSGQYEPQKAKATLSNAMDVGDPSNFTRILQLFDQDYLSLKEHLRAESISDEETIATIRSVYEQYRYILDPHGAVGYAALQHYLALHSSLKGYFLETAHPVKFHETMEPLVGYISTEAVDSVIRKPKQSIKLKADYKDLKEYLFSTK